MNDHRDENYLRRALDLARKARGGVSPRPPVGAVIVRNGEVVGEGMTEPRPGMHAEVAAIRAAGDAARGATMYCSLEPHAHQGVSAPCTEEIIDAGIARLICPVEDPNPQVDGNGFRRLRTAGIDVVTATSATVRNDAEEIISGFRMLVLQGRPQFTLKYAMSLDGKIATSTGDSQWITGREARAEAHRLRHRSDAVVTGIGTVLADDPRLTARSSADGPTDPPRLRVVVDSQGRMPANARMLSEGGEILLITGDKKNEQRPGVEIAQVELVNGVVDPADVVRLLADRGCCDVLIEAGGRLSGTFLDAGLVDRVAAFIGPVMIGGHDAPGPAGGDGFARLADAPTLRNLNTKELGDSLLVTGEVVRE